MEEELRGLFIISPESYNDSVGIWIIIGLIKTSYDVSGVTITNKSNWIINLIDCYKIIFLMCDIINLK